MLFDKKGAIYRRNAICTYRFYCGFCRFGSRCVELRGIWRGKNKNDKVLTLR